MSAKILIDIRDIIENNDIHIADALISRIHALNTEVQGTARLFASLTQDERSVLIDFDAMKQMARGVSLLMLAAKALHVNLAARASDTDRLTSLARDICGATRVTMHLHNALVTKTFYEFIQDVGDLVLNDDLNLFRTRRLYQQSRIIIPRITQKLIAQVINPAKAQWALYTQNVQLIDLIVLCLTFFESWLDAADSAAVVMGVNTTVSDIHDTSDLSDIVQGILGPLRAARKTQDHILDPIHANPLYSVWIYEKQWSSLIRAITRERNLAFAAGTMPAKRNPDGSLTRAARSEKQCLQIMQEINPDICSMIGSAVARDVDAQYNPLAFLRPYIHR